MKKTNYKTMIGCLGAYIFGRIIRNITGFHYSFSEGINIRFLMDFSLWVVSFCVCLFVINKIYSIIAK